MLEKRVEDGSEQPQNNNNWGDIIKWFFIIFLWLITIFSGLDWQNKTFTLYQHTLVLGVCAFVATIGLLFFKNYLDSLNRGKSSTYIIMHPELQFSKIRKLAIEEYGVRLGRCYRTGRSPPTGESSAMPHTLHFLFEKLSFGKFSGWVIVDNSLIKDSNVFWFSSIEAWVRNNPTSYWWGEIKNIIQQKISETSVGESSLKNVLTHEEAEETNGSAVSG